MLFDAHTHQSKQDSILNLFPQEEIPDQYFSVGIHPWYVDNLESQKEQLIQKSKHPNCLAIGECGLDRLCGTDLVIQKEVFEYQLDLAQRMDKPVIVHCVRAFDLLLPKIKCSKVPVIIHGFNQNREIFRQFLKIENVYFSFGHAIFTANSNAQKTLLEWPLTRFFLETDDKSDLQIEDVYVKASELLNLSVDELKKQINNNFQTVFR